MLTCAPGKPGLRLDGRSAIQTTKTWYPGRTGTGHGERHLGFDSRAMRGSLVFSREKVVCNQNWKPVTAVLHRDAKKEGKEREVPVNHSTFVFRFSESLGEVRGAEHILVDLFDH